MKSVAQIADIRSFMRSDQVNALGYTGKGVGVAFLDTGFDRSDIPLKDWYDPVSGSSEPVDLTRNSKGEWVRYGHGTKSAGCIKTTAPDAELIGIRHDRSPESIAAGVRWAIENQHRLNIGVLNMSVAGGSHPALTAAIQEAVDKGIVVVASMGNNGPNNNEEAAPANLPEVISVGAAKDRTTVSEFSSRGLKNDGKQKPDLCAPGEGVQTWMSPGSHFHKFVTEVDDIRKMSREELFAFFEANPDKFGAWKNLPKDALTRTNGFRLISDSIPEYFKIDDFNLVSQGTSLSAPLVSGIIATLLEAHPEATPDKIREALHASAKPMNSEFGPEAQGAGFIDAFDALAHLGLPPESVT